MAYYVWKRHGNKTILSLKASLPKNLHPVSKNILILLLSLKVNQQDSKAKKLIS